MIYPHHVHQFETMSYAALAKGGGHPFNFCRNLKRAPHR